MKKGGASPVGPMRGLIILTLILTIILTTHNNWHDTQDSLRKMSQDEWKEMGVDSGGHRVLQGPGTVCV